MFGQLRFDDKMLEWVYQSLHASEGEHKRVGERIDPMYIYKLDGRVGGDFFDKMVGESREGQGRLQRDTDRHWRVGAISPTWKTACRFSNSHATLKRCSNASPLAKNGSFSISYFRTAHGRMVG